MTEQTIFAPLKPAQASYFLLMLVCIVFVFIAGFCALTMEHAGHIITGMNNHVVWGLPHVFAVSLIVAASGALNGASLSSVFGLSHYKPVARLSVVLAMCLLVGGLLVLVLDLGRPDRLLVAMTTFNFRSIFSWNIFLYTGFMLVGAAYLWMMMDKPFNRYIKRVGVLALTWRIVLTTGTGSIFGFLVGRNALDSALLAPLFIALSLVMGTAILALATMQLDRWRRSVCTAQLIQSLSRLLIGFLVLLAYFSAVQHITNLYVREHDDTERYVLLGDLSGLFWLGHVVVGIVLPLFLLLGKSDAISTYRRLFFSSALSLLGCMALIYVVIIGSQSTPQTLFPGKTVLASDFGDAGFPVYLPSVWEWGLGLGGVFLAILLCLLVLRILPLVPANTTTPSQYGR